MEQNSLLQRSMWAGYFQIHVRLLVLTKHVYMKLFSEDYLTVSSLVMKSAYKIIQSKIIMDKNYKFDVF